MASFIRCWVIRGVILAVLVALGYAGWFAATWISPEKVRAALVEKLQSRVDESIEVHVGEAHLKIFGGIAVSDLRLTRRETDEPILSIPHAVIYHDKERLQHGELGVRKLEFLQPTIHLRRLADKSWNLQNVFKPDSQSGATPTIIITDATIFYTDESNPAMPPIALIGTRIQVLSESSTMLKIEGETRIVAAAAIDEQNQLKPGMLAFAASVNARFSTPNRHITARIVFPDLAISPDLAPLIEKFQPELARYAMQFEAKANVVLEIVSVPDQPVKTEVQVDLRDGNFTDAMLPWPIAQLAGTVRYQDGRIIVEKLTGKLGHAQAELTLKTRAGLLAPCTKCRRVGPLIRSIAMEDVFQSPWVKAHPEDLERDPFQVAEASFDRFELSVNGLSLDDDLFARLTPKMNRVREMFNPKGGVNVSVRYHRSETDGSWRRELELKPNRLTIEYEKFHYPVSELTGSFKKVIASDGTDEFQLNLIGSLGGRRVDISGKVAGDGPDPYYSVRIAGNDIPIDAKLFAALPAETATAMAKFRATARGDFLVDLKQDYQVNRAENTFNIRVYNGIVNYQHFPYPFQQVRGNVLVRTTYSDPTRPLRPGMSIGSTGPATHRVELKHFEAVHDGGRLWLSGENEAVAGTKDRKMTVRLQGENWPIDNDFRTAMKELKLENATQTLALKGDMTFGADIEMWDRALPKELPALVRKEADADGGVQPVAAALPGEPPFNPKSDLKIAFNFKGPTITPTFFPYEMHNFAGLLRYQGGRLELVKMSARHGATELRLDAGEMRTSTNGDIWANLGGISIAPLATDAAFLRALPAKLKSGFEDLKLRGAAELYVKHLVVSIPETSKKVPQELPQLTIPVVNPRGQLPDEPLMSLPPIVPNENDRWRGVEGIPARAATKTSVPEVKVTTPTPGILPNIQFPWQKPKPEANVASVPVQLPKEADESPTVFYWNASLKLTGASLEIGLPWDDVYGTIASTGRHEGTHLGAVSGNAWFDKATISRQPITSAKLGFRVRAQQPDSQRAGVYQAPAIEIHDISASLFQGTIGGEGRVVLADPMRYRLWLTASGVRLDDLAKHYKIATSAELKGLAQGQILLENMPDSKTGELITTGSGQIDVPQGRMYNLPVLLELVKVLKGQTPDGCAFEEAHATFELKGDRVKVTQLDLLGSAVSLGGSGELDTSGQYVKFDFYTIWSQTLRRWLSTPLGDVTGLLSGSLFKIELTRENGRLTPKAHMLPVVSDPVRAVAERLRNRTARPHEVPAQPTTIRATSGR